MSAEKNTRKNIPAVWYTVPVVVLIVFAFFYASKHEKSQGSPQPAVVVDSAADSSFMLAAGSTAPDFTLTDSSGRNVHLSDFSGKVLIVDFWATWCPSCRQEIPGFIDLQKRYASKGLQVVGVSVDEKGWQVVTPFMQVQGVNYPILLGNDDVVRAYGNFDAIPVTFLIDKHGKIVKEFSGLYPPEEFEKAVTSVL